MWAFAVQVMDMFVEQTHYVENSARLADKPLRFTDTRIDEQERGISLKMTPMSFIMEASSSKSYLLNVIDTPGEFIHNLVTPMRLAAGEGNDLQVQHIEGVQASHQVRMRFKHNATCRL